MVDSLDDEGAELPFTGERFVPGDGGGQIAVEHAHRYMWAAPLVAGMDVVDLGSGSGYAANLLAGTKSYVGYDIARDAVAFAQRKFGAPTVSFEVADVADTQRAESSTDVVICFEVLEHVENPGDVVREAKRILRPGGIFVSSTPDKSVYNRSRTEPNPFHVAEMERCEYEHLLSTYFSHTRLLGQAVATASWLLEESHEATGASSGMTLTDADLPGVGIRPEPVYWLGIASDAHLPQLSEGAMLGGGADREDLERVLTQLRVTEAELQARSDALESADAREMKARIQLADYEATIHALQSRLDAAY